MPAVPKDQSAEHRRLGTRRGKRSPAPVTSANERHGDRGSSDDEGADDDGDDDDDAALRLPAFVRFSDIKAANIATSWEQLYRLIDKEGFPPGVMLSPNIRAWPIADVRSWLKHRPSERKPVPNAWPESRREAAAEEKRKRAAERADPNAAGQAR